MLSTEVRARQIEHLILILLVISLGLRVRGLDTQSIWRDEADSLRFASSPAQLQEMFLTPGHNAPLYYLALRGWTQLAGGDIISARFFSALWGTLGIALLWAVGRRLIGSRASFLAALIAGTSPYLVWYAQEARTYSVLVAMTLLSFLLYLKAMEHGGVGRWAMYLVCAGASLYLHVAAVLMLPVHALAGLLLRPKGKEGWRAWGVVTALLLLPAIPLLSWEIRLLLSPFQTGHAPAGAGEIAAGLLLAITSGPSGQRCLWWALPGLFLALIGIASPLLSHENSAQGDSWRHIWIILAWLLFPIGGLLAVSAIMPLFSERYLIFVAPAFYLLVGLGIRALWKIWRPLAMAGIAAILAINCAGLWVQNTQIIKPDIRGAAAYYAENRQAGDLVLFLIPQNQGAFEHIAPGEGARYAGVPYANRAQRMIDVEGELRQVVGDSRRVWLVESEPNLWDSRGLTRQWLADQSQNITTWSFHLVTLTLFDR